MTRAINALNLSILLLISGFTFSQEAKGIYFKSGVYHPTDLSFEYNESELVNGQYYRIIQFSEIPTEEEKRALESEGIRLLDYLPKNAFYAQINKGVLSVHESKYSITSIEPIQETFKLSEQLMTKNYPHWTLFGDDQIEVNALYFEGATETQALNELASIGALILNKNDAQTIQVRLPINKLESLYGLNSFYYFEAIGAPEEPENLVGRTDHRSNILATDYASGLKYDGTGVNVMMQDDGYIGDHIDYEGRVDQSNCSGCSWNDANNHGDHVAGTIMGAGNLNPRYRGMAFGADLFVFNSSNANYDDVPALYTNDDIVITSKSYSSGCNGGYDSRARQLDGQIYDMPNLIHVFSAGNSGASNCGYGAGAGWGNITGGHKSGKNVIAVGNLTYSDNLASSSSRGPATDGRIKPDVCGVGTDVNSTISDYTYASFTGTSMSCPGVAGSIAQLYQAYKDANAGVNPKSALIKAALLNTAKDLGNPGPDFKHGWGRINISKAHKLISQNDYTSSTIAQGATNSHTVNVQSGTTKLKIMVYWADYKGSTAASTALVNDLNMIVTDPALVPFSPWVLDPTPNVSALNSVAVPGTDDLNNMEQVTIDNPIVGSYTVDITGFAVPQGPQEYFVVYEFESDEVDLTYPIGGEGLHPNTWETIRWDATDGTTDFTLEYSTDNGGSWNPIGTVPANQRWVNWQVPSTLSGLAKVKITRNASSDESDDVFSIIEVPTGLDVGWACPDSLNLTWNAVAGATGYEVSMLGAKYMDSLGTTAATNLTVIVNSASENWYSVRALGPNNARSERAVAIRKLPGQFGCTWGPPTANFTLDCDTASTAECVQFYNASLNTGGATNYTWYFPTGTPSTSNLEDPVVCFSTSGYHDAALVVDNGGPTDSVYFSNAVYIVDPLSLPFHEGFENISNFTSQSFWKVNNPDNNSTFTVSNSAAKSGVKSARLSNTLQQNGDVDELISGPLDLSPLDPGTDIVTMSFRYAYNRKTTSDDDWMRFSVSSGCGTNWNIRKTLHGSFLNSVIQATSYVPQDTSEWITTHITNIVGSYYSGDFRFKFNFENGGGNNFFIDDINLYSGGPSETVVSGIEEGELGNLFRVYPNPVEEDLTITFDLISTGNVAIKIKDVSGKVVQQVVLKGSSGVNAAFVDVSSLSTGSYFVSLSNDNGTATKKFIKK